MSDTAPRITRLADAPRGPFVIEEATATVRLIGKGDGDPLLPRDEKARGAVLAHALILAAGFTTELRLQFGRRTTLDITFCVPKGADITAVSDNMRGDLRAFMLGMP
jgi:hypothetical protein